MTIYSQQVQQAEIERRRREAEEARKQAEVQAEAQRLMQEAAQKAQADTTTKAIREREEAARRAEETRKQAEAQAEAQRLMQEAAQKAQADATANAIVAQREAATVREIKPSQQVLPGQKVINMPGNRSFAVPNTLKPAIVIKTEDTVDDKTKPPFQGLITSQKIDPNEVVKSRFESLDVIYVTKTTDPDKFIVWVADKDGKPTAVRMTREEVLAYGGEIPAKGVWGKKGTAGEKQVQAGDFTEDQIIAAYEALGLKPPSDLRNAHMPDADDKIAAELGISDGVESPSYIAIIKRFKENPYADEFKLIGEGGTITAEEKILLATAAGVEGYNPLRDYISSTVALRTGERITKRDYEAILKADKENKTNYAEIIKDTGVEGYKNVIAKQAEMEMADFQTGDPDGFKAYADAGGGNKGYQAYQKFTAERLEKQVDELPDPLKEAYKAGGYDAYLKAFDDYYIKVKDQYIERDAFLKVDVKYRKIAWKEGLPAMFDAIRKDTVTINGTTMTKESFNKLPEKYKTIFLTSGYDTMNLAFATDEKNHEAALKALATALNPDGETYDFNKLAQIVRKTPNGAQFIRDANFNDPTLLPRIQEHNEKPWVKETPLEKLNARIREKYNIDPQKHLGSYLSKEDREYIKYLNEVVYKDPEIAKMKKLAYDYSGKKEEPTVSLETFERLFLDARGVEDVSWVSRNDEALGKEGDLKLIAGIEYSRLYGPTKSLSSKSIQSASLVFSPARVLYPDVELKNISKLEWAVGAFQVGLLALGPLQSAAAKVFSPAAGRLLGVAGGLAAGGVFTADTVVNWKDISRSPTNTALAIGIDALIIGSSLLGMRGLKPKTASNIEGLTNKAGVKIVDTAKVSPEAKAYEVSYDVTKNSIQAINKTVDTLKKAKALSGETGAGITVSNTAIRNALEKTLLKMKVNASVRSALLKSNVIDNIKAIIAEQGGKGIVANDAVDGVLRRQLAKMGYKADELKLNIKKVSVDVSNAVKWEATKLKTSAAEISGKLASQKGAGITVSNTAIRNALEKTLLKMKVNASVRSALLKSNVIDNIKAIIAEQGGKGIVANDAVDGVLRRQLAKMGYKAGEGKLIAKAIQQGVTDARSGYKRLTPSELKSTLDELAKAIKSKNIDNIKKAGGKLQRIGENSGGDTGNILKQKGKFVVDHAAEIVKIAEKRLSAKQLNDITGRMGNNLDFMPEVSETVVKRYQKLQREIEQISKDLRDNESIIAKAEVEIAKKAKPEKPFDLTKSQIEDAKRKLSLQISQDNVKLRDLQTKNADPYYIKKLMDRIDRASAELVKLEGKPAATDIGRLVNQARKNIDELTQKLISKRAELYDFMGGDKLARKYGKKIAGQEPPPVKGGELLQKPPDTTTKSGGTATKTKEAPAKTETKPKEAEPDIEKLKKAKEKVQEEKKTETKKETEKKTTTKTYTGNDIPVRIRQTEGPGYWAITWKNGVLGWEWIKPNRLAEPYEVYTGNKTKHREHEVPQTVKEFQGVKSLQKAKVLFDNEYPEGMKLPAAMPVPKQEPQPQPSETPKNRPSNPKQGELPKESPNPVDIPKPVPVTEPVPVPENLKEKEKPNTEITEITDETKKPPPPKGDGSDDKEKEWTAKEFNSSLKWKDGFVIHALKSPYRPGVDVKSFNIKNLPAGFDASDAIEQYKGRGSQEKSARVTGKFPAKLTVDVGNQDAIFTRVGRNRAKLRHVRDISGTVSRTTIKQNNYTSRKKGRLYKTDFGGGTITSRRPLRGLR